ncbi:MAG: hypothetical protein JWR67_3655 [Mucilaginibacter sp.]|nr:hypothetical protein [Mucilaginibacter sp.]
MVTTPTTAEVYTKLKSPSAVLKGFCDLGEDRTLDPLIKSQLLYRLSYQVKVYSACGRCYHRTTSVGYFDLFHHFNFFLYTQLFH